MGRDHFPKDDVVFIDHFQKDDVWRYRLTDRQKIAILDDVVCVWPQSEIIMNIYVMGITQVDLLDIVQVKVGFFAVLKMCIGVIGVHLEKFVWSALFVQCAPVLYNQKINNLSKVYF